MSDFIRPSLEVKKINIEITINDKIMYKVSIVMPVYNCEDYLTDSLDSILNQSIGFKNIEVIMVDDASTDGTGVIIDEYASRYSNFKAVHLAENIGAAYGPRNVGLKHASSEYVMFLDGDDTFVETACEVLFDEISSSGADMVFGRYYRVYDDVVLESYSPYSSGDNDIKINPRFSGPVSFIWSKIAYPILYGSSKSLSGKIVDVRKNPEILKILPSIWTKIVRKDSIGEFPCLITGEDLNFILDVYDSGKIVFLNDEFITNYYMRFDGDLSITKNVKFQLVLDSIRAYRIAVEKCNEYGFPKYSKMINPFLVNFINLLRQADLSDDEKEILSGEIDLVDAKYKNRGVVGSLLLKIIKFLVR